MVSDITTNTGATLLLPGSAVEQLSSEAHTDSEQQMGCVNQLCDVMCHSVSLLQGRKPTRSIFLRQKLPVLGGFSVFTFLPIEIGKIKGSVQAGERSGVTGAISRH